jgi:hypothetical protein
VLVENKMQVAWKESVYGSIGCLVNNARSVLAAQIWRQCFAPSQTKLHYSSHVSVGRVVRAEGTMISEHSGDRFFEVHHTYQGWAPFNESRTEFAATLVFEEENPWSLQSR